MKKGNKKTTWGGARPGAGRPKSATKTKISVTVESTVLDTALGKWRGCRSRLVERLLRFYNSKAGLIPALEGKT